MVQSAGQEQAQAQAQARVVTIMEPRIMVIVEGIILVIVWMESMMKKRQKLRWRCWFLGLFYCFGDLLPWLVLVLVLTLMVVGVG